MFLDRREETHCDISHEDRDSWELAERGQLHAFFWFSSLRPVVDRVTCCRPKLVGVVARNARGRLDARTLSGMGLRLQMDVRSGWAWSGSTSTGDMWPLFWGGAALGGFDLAMCFKFTLPIFDSGEERRLDTSCLFQLMLRAVVGRCVFYERNGSSVSQ